MCVCVCFLPINSGHQVRWTYQPGFFIHLPSAVRALMFLAKGIHHSFPSSTVKSNFVYQQFNRSPLVGHFIFILFYFSQKNPVYRDRTHIPTCQKVTRLPLSYRGDRLCSWSAGLKCKYIKQKFKCPRSRLRVVSRERRQVMLVRLSRVSQLILHARP